MELEIRQVTTNDYPKLLEILNDAMHYKTTRSDHSWGDEKFTTEELSGYQQTADMYVAEAAGEIVGTFALTWDNDSKWVGQPHTDAAYLHRLAIASDKHGWKLGEKIVKLAEKVTVEHHRHALRLDCNADAMRLCQYYESLGFERVATSRFGNYQAALYEHRL